MHIPNRNLIRAAAHRYRIMLARFRSVRQEKRQAKIRRAALLSRTASPGNRITQTIYSRQTLRAIQLCVAVRQEISQLPIRQRAFVLLRTVIPQEMVRSHNTQAVRRIRQRPVRQERSARPSADVIPSRCSRRRAFPRMEIPRSRSRSMFLPSSPVARCSRPAEPAWMAALQIGSILHPQCRHLRQRRLPTAKLVHLRARPRGLMQRVRQNSTLRSAQFPRKAAAQKSHRKLLRIRLPLLPNGRAGNRRPHLLWAA